VRIADEAESLGTVLNRLTQRTLWVAKQVRTNTDIGKSNVGIGNAGVFLAQQIFSTLRGRRVMLVGVGEMGRQVAKAMVNSGIRELLVANRTLSKSLEMAQEFGATALRFEHIREYLHRVDIVITATGATRPILSVADVRGAMRSRRYRPLFLVDLAVPRNIASEVENLDQAYLFNVDDLTKVMDKGKKAREEASQAAERIVALETERFSDRLATLEVNEAIGEITRQVEQIRTAELMRSRKLLETLDPVQRSAIDRMTRSMMKKVLHSPLRSIRDAVKQGDVGGVDVMLNAWQAREDEDSSR
jgi:glutamyl-tRNA reductase